MNIDNEDVILKAALKAFGDLARRKRQASHWNFRELAEKTGVDVVILSELEDGENTATEAEREKICEFLGIDIDTFPRLLRNHRSQAEKTAREARDNVEGGAVIELRKYREKWQKTTSHPEG